jgi:hypothetical protein
METVGMHSATPRRPASRVETCWFLQDQTRRWSAACYSLCADFDRSSKGMIAPFCQHQRRDGVMYGAMGRWSQTGNKCQYGGAKTTRLWQAGTKQTVLETEDAWEGKVVLFGRLTKPRQRTKQWMMLWQEAVDLSAGQESGTKRYTRDDPCYRPRGCSGDGGPPRRS